MPVRVKYVCWVNGALLFIGLFFFLKLESKGCSSQQEPRVFNVETVQFLQHEKRLIKPSIARTFHTSKRDESKLPTALRPSGKTTSKQQPLPNSPLMTLENIINSLQEQFSLSVKKFKSKKWKNEELDVESMKYSQPKCGRRKPFLLIEVHSKPESFLARQAIRLTWGTQKNHINQLYYDNRFSWKTVFLVGKSQDERINGLMVMEAKRHQDVIIGDFLDTYRNLTYKTLLTIEYPSTHCLNARYIMKTDDDCYINVKSVIQWLISQHNSTANDDKPIYMGRIHWANTPTRDNSSKYYVTREEYKEDVYPPYAAGGGYVFTGSLLPKLLRASKSIAVFPMEDAYFGLLMQTIGVKATNHSLVLPYTFCDCESNDDDCQTWYDDSVCNIAVAMVIHDVRPDEQIRTHINVMTVNNIPTICKHEKRRNTWKESSCDFSKKQLIS